MAAQAIHIFTIVIQKHEIAHSCHRQLFSNLLLHLRAKNSKVMKYPLLFFINIIVVLFYTKANAQIGNDVRFDTYSNLELNGYTKHNTVILSSNQDKGALLDNAMLSSFDNLVIRDIYIDDVLLERINKLDVSNVQLYNVSGNVDSLFSIFMSMPTARALRIDNVTVGEDFTKHAWSSIKRLEISNCNIQSISDVLKQMTKATYISITNSRIDSISFDTILPSLVYLDLSDCELFNIPYSIKKCPNLECFRYYNNHFQKTDCDVLRNNTYLRELHLGDCGIREFPTGLIALPHLQILVLKGNHIENIPDEISRFKELKYLGLGRTSYLLNKEIIDSLNVSFSIDKLPD